jgi:Kdo2-lipid IVA lauroyltransferase/acyltransferase
MLMGSALLYYLVMWPLSRMPYFVLYGVSDMLYFFVYRVARYRRIVVNENLRLCFPDKDEKWILDVEKKFYHHLADLVIESVKNFSISGKTTQIRMKGFNQEIANQFYEKGRSVVICGGHYCNWELWAMASPGQLKHEMIGVYKQLSNPFFNQKMKESRARFGMRLVPTVECGKFLRENTELVKAVVLAFDQSPANPDKCIWVDFLGRKTASYFGAEKYARDFNMPIVYGRMKKIKRGFYEVHYELLVENPNEWAQGDITRQLYKILEEEIALAPEYWLWSHKRWKHKPPAHLTQ